MNILVFRCPPHGHYHFGTSGLESAGMILHSDTIFSAWTVLWQSVYGSADEWVDWVMSHRVRFSSGIFSVQKQGDTTPLIFYPKPLLDFAMPKESNTALMKKMKKISFISSGVLDIIRKASIQNNFSTTVALHDFVVFNSVYCITKDEAQHYGLHQQDEGILHDMTLPKVKVHTQETDGRLYHVSSQYVETRQKNIVPILQVFLEHSLKEEEWQKFQTIVRISADEGFGGERSTGYGWFESVDVYSLPQPPQNTHETIRYWMNTSVFSPLDPDEFSSVQRYDLIERGGGSLGQYGDAERHRKRIRMIREGAVLSAPVQGVLRDVSPDDNPMSHAIYRCGTALCVPLA